MDAKDKETLLDVARQSIEVGASTGAPLAVRAADYSEGLQLERATFTTLKKKGDLRGCVGVMEAFRPLVEDVAETAFAAAFRDTRFRPVRAEEITSLDIAISILSPLEEVKFSSQEDLIGKMRPGVDGLFLQDGYYRGSFLPVMWEELPSPQEFLHHLKIKAGLPPTYWSDTVQIFRYTAEKIP